MTDHVLLCANFNKVFKLQNFGDFFDWWALTSICQVLVFKFEVLKAPSWWLIMLCDLHNSTRCSSFKTSVTFWLMSAHIDLPSSWQFENLKFWNFPIDDWSYSVIFKFQSGVDSCRPLCLGSKVTWESFFGWLQSSFLGDFIFLVGASRISANEWIDTELVSRLNDTCPEQAPPCPWCLVGHLPACGRCMNASVK